VERAELEGLDGCRLSLPKILQGDGISDREGLVQFRGEKFNPLFPVGIAEPYLDAAGMLGGGIGDGGRSDPVSRLEGRFVALAGFPMSPGIFFTTGLFMRVLGKALPLLLRTVRTERGGWTIAEGTPKPPDSAGMAAGIATELSRADVIRITHGFTFRYLFSGEIQANW
jgi:hypothetical protein